MDKQKVKSIIMRLVESIEDIPATDKDSLDRAENLIDASLMMILGDYKGKFANRHKNLLTDLVESLKGDMSKGDRQKTISLIDSGIDILIEI